MTHYRLVILAAICAGSLVTLQAQTRRDFGSTRSPRHDPAPMVSSPSRDGGRVQDQPMPQPPPPRVEPQPILVVHPDPVPVYIEGGTDIVLLPVAEVPGIPAREKTTVRFPVMGAEILDRWSRNDCSGYDFEDMEVVPFNDDDADLRFDGLTDAFLVPTDTDIQDLGVSSGIREGLRVRKDGWATDKRFQAIAGHQYALWRWNGDLAKLYVQEVFDDGVVFDWMPAGSLPRRAADAHPFGR